MRLIHVDLMLCEGECEGKAGGARLMITTRACPIPCGIEFFLIVHLDMHLYRGSVYRMFVAAHKTSVQVIQQNRVCVNLKLRVCKALSSLFPRVSQIVWSYGTSHIHLEVFRLVLLDFAFDFGNQIISTLT